MPLNDRQIRNAKPADKLKKLSDGNGLTLVLHPKGGKYWQLNYRFEGRQKTLSIGTYPAVSLVEAREAAQKARAVLAQGQDPAAAKQEAKAERAAAQQRVFERLACEWHAANLTAGSRTTPPASWTVCKRTCCPIWEAARLTILPQPM